MMFRFGLWFGIEFELRFRFDIMFGFKIFGLSLNLVIRLN